MKLINFPYKDLTEIIYNQDGIEIEVKDGILFIGVDDINKLDEAKDIALLYLSAWSERQNMKIHVELNHTWKK